MQVETLHFRHTHRCVYEATHFRLVFLAPGDGSICAQKINKQVKKYMKPVWKWAVPCAINQSASRPSVGQLAVDSKRLELGCMFTLSDDSFWAAQCSWDGGLNEPLEPEFLWGTDMQLFNEKVSSLLKRYLQQTLTYWSAFFSFGLCISFLGPTILDLKCQTQSTLDQITWVFFSQQFFLLVGSCLGGAFQKTWVMGTTDK